MRRVLIVTPGYYPAKTYGGPVVSIKNLTDLLGDKIDFYILTSNHELNENKMIEGLPQGFSSYGKNKGMLYFGQRYEGSKFSAHH